MQSNRQALWSRLRQLRGHRVVHNALWLYSVQITSYLLPLITLPYLSRVLSVEHFGLLAFAQSIVWNFVVLTDYGFNLTATREIAAQRDQPEAVSKTFSAVMAAKTLLGVLGFCALAALVFSVGKLRTNWPLYLISYLSVLGYMVFPLWLFQGLEKMRMVAVRDFTAKLLAVIALFLLVRSDEDYLWAAAAQSGGLFLAGLLGLASVPFAAPVKVRRPAWNEIWNAYRTGWPPFLSNAASTVAYSANLALLGMRGGAAEIGFLNAAYRITSVPRALVTPLSTAVFSHVSRTAAGFEREAIRFVQRNGLLLAVPFLLMSAGLILTSPFVVSLVLGPKYGPALVPLQILSLGPLIVALSHTYSTYYMLACGHDKAWMRIMLASLAVSFAIFLPALLVLRASVALALAMIASEAFALAGYWRFYRRRSRTLAVN